MRRRDFLRLTAAGAGAAGAFGRAARAAHRAAGPSTEIPAARAARAAGPGRTPRPTGRRPALPHIVFILADDMGYGDVHCFNPDSPIPTPNMDRLARQGIRLTDAHSPSAVCTPTRYGILTGRYCWRTWLKRGVIGGYTPPLIEPHRTTVASLLKRHGYRTGCFGKWHLGLGWTRRNGFVGTWKNAKDHFRGSWQDGDPAKGMDVDFTKPIHGGPTVLGFDYAFITAACSTIDGPFCFIENDHTVGIPDRPMPIDKSKHPDFRPRPGWTMPGFDLTQVDPTFTRKAVAFLQESRRRHPDRPCFVYLALSSPHAPWLPPDFVKGKSGLGPREDLVVLVDWCVGQVMAALERLGMAEDTLLIVTSDNGPREGTDGHRPAGPWRGLKSHIWEGGHRVPFIARWPGRIPAGATSDEPICLTDLLATCAAIVGDRLGDDEGPDSYNVLPALLGRKGDRPIREAIVSHSVFGVFAIRQGPWKLILDCPDSGGWVRPRGHGPKPGTPGQLYNLAEDPGERHNLYDAHPEIVARLRALLERYRRSGRSAPRT